MQKRPARPYPEASAEARMGFALTDFTIGQVLAKQAEKLGDRTYLHYIPDGRTYSYRDAHRISSIIANNLVRLGIQQGQHVADMPRSGTHKVEKYKLQKEAQADLNAYWDREKAGIVIRRR